MNNVHGPLPSVNPSHDPGLKNTAGVTLSGPTVLALSSYGLLT